MGNVESVVRSGLGSKHNVSKLNTRISTNTPVSTPTSRSTQERVSMEVRAREGWEGATAGELADNEADNVPTPSKDTTAVTRKKQQQTSREKHRESKITQLRRPSDILDPVVLPESTQQGVLASSPHTNMAA